jgi:hypothetical protein
MSPSVTVVPGTESSRAQQLANAHLRRHFEPIQHVIASRARAAIV